jgi:DNA-binding transcriptional ArsR family regulator
MDEAAIEGAVRSPSRRPPVATASTGYGGVDCAERAATIVDGRSRGRHPTTMTTGLQTNVTTDSVADDDLLDVLGDETSRAILAAASDSSVPAKELTELNDVSSATVYRRISTLVERGLLEERHSIDEGGSRQKVYATTFENVDVSLDEEGFAATPHDCTTVCYHLLSVLRNLPFEELRADFSERTIQIELELTDDVIAQVSSLWQRSDE